jgi:hypothetical protein
VLIRHRAPICATVLLAAVFWASVCASRPSGTTTPARHRPVPPAAAEDYKVTKAYGRQGAATTTSDRTAATAYLSATEL